MNFSTFYAQAIKNKSKKIKKGKYKGQPGSLIQKDIPKPGPAYYRQPSKLSAPSASTYKVVG